MSNYFEKISEIQFEGKSSNNPLSFKYYDENKIVLGKTMKDHLRFATCYWHTFTWPGLDPFGGPTFDRPWMAGGDPLQMAKIKLDAAFDFFIIELMSLSFHYYQSHYHDQCCYGMHFLAQIVMESHQTYAVFFHLNTIH